MKKLKSNLGKRQKQMLLHAYICNGLFSLAKNPEANKIAESLEKRGLLKILKWEKAGWQAEITEKGKLVS